MPSQHNWTEYYSLTRARPPRPLLVEALVHVINKRKALDMGAGALADSRYLIEQGFDVTAIDQDPHTTQEAKEIDSPRFHLIITQYDQFDFPVDAYDLVSAQFALPFNPPHSFNEMFDQLKVSLHAGGILCGQFFGNNDEWNTSKSDMTFHTQADVKALLSDFKLVKFQEEEKDGTTANGTPKHWHIFHVIAKAP